MLHVRAHWARLGLAGAGEQGAGGLSGWWLLWAGRAAAPWLSFRPPLVVRRVPVNRARASGAHRGAAAAGVRLPRPGSHLVSGAGAARAPHSGTGSKPEPQRAGRRGGRRRAGGYRCLSPAALGSRPRAVGEGGWVVVAAEEEGSGGGDQLAPARPSPARCPGRTRRPGRRWRTSRRRSRTCRPWWDTPTGSPSPPR